MRVLHSTWVRPLTFKSSATARKELSWSWAMLTSPLYMKARTDSRSEKLTPRRKRRGWWCLCRLRTCLKWVCSTRDYQMLLSQLIKSQRQAIRLKNISIWSRRVFSWRMMSRQTRWPCGQRPPCQSRTSGWHRRNPRHLSAPGMSRWCSSRSHSTSNKIFPPTFWDPQNELKKVFFSQPETLCSIFCLFSNGQFSEWMS